MFATPGNADILAPELLQQWNDTIQANYDALSSLHSRFFVLDPSALHDPQQVEAIAWSGDPAEPTFCVNDDSLVQKITDWGSKGRHALQNEYCEYAIQVRPDQSGKLRPKRVELTTELREYWVTIATHDPVRVREIASEVLGFGPTWQDLYGVPNPQSLSESQRRITFSRTVAGHGMDDALKKKGVPEHPVGSLNTEHALFMSHPINGLDDLLYIVMFGAQPYATKTAAGGVQRASLSEIFAAAENEVLACRHADPTAAKGAYDQAFQGKTVAFANPIGMYMRPIEEEVFSFQGKALPKDWITYSRGDEGRHQRLVFGPPDDHDAFLDDIVVPVGADDQPLTGGYQIVQHMEVGPIVAVGDGDNVRDDEWQFVPVHDDIDCAKSTACGDIQQLLIDFRKAHSTLAARPGRRIL